MTDSDITDPIVSLLFERERHRLAVWLETGRAVQGFTPRRSDSMAALSAYHAANQTQALINRLLWFAALERAVPDYLA